MTRPWHLAAPGQVTARGDEAAAWLLRYGIPGDLWMVAAEASEDAVFGLDAAGLIISWNTGAARLFGYSAAEVVGGPSTVLVPEHLMVDQSHLVERVLSGERIDRVQLEGRRSDGMVLLVTLTLLPLGPGQGVCAVVRDLTEQRVAQTTLAESELRLREAQQLGHVGLWLWDSRTDVLEMSEEFHTIHGIDPLRFGGSITAYLDLVHPNDRVNFDIGLHRAVRDRCAFEHEYRVLRPGGELRWVYARAAVDMDERAGGIALRGICQDISERKNAAELLRRKASLLDLLRRIAVTANEATDLSQALHGCLDQVCLHTGWEIGRVRFVDDGAAAAASGLWSGDSHARFESFREAMDHSAPAPLPGPLPEAFNARPIWTADLTAVAGFPAAAAAAVGLVSALAFPLVVGAEVVAVLEFFSSSPTEPDRQLIESIWAGTTQLGRVVERDRAQAALSHRVLHDALTGLPNRTLLLDRLAQALKRRSSVPSLLVVIFVDLDDFKAINDRLGHAAGDHLLVTVAQRLRRVIRQGDTAARFGGDEFVIVSERFASAAVAVQMVERLLAAVTQPVLLHGEITVVTASAGIALAAGDAAPETLIRDADAAMYRAKKTGRGRYQIFDGVMHRRAEDRLAMARDLRTAVETGQLRLHYQPQVAIADGRLLGVEALVRWEHPTRGLIGPEQFISVAEETSSIVELGGWVMGEACRQAAAWQRLRPTEPPLRMCVNVSPKQLGRPELINDIARGLAETGLDAASLELDITEQVFMGDREFFMEALLQLTRLGVAISIDDFGTGSSSLAYLQRFPIDSIKLDNAFIGDLAQGGVRARAVLAAVIDLAHAFDLYSVAEGVETQQQLESLEQLGCDAGQGHFLGRPMPADAMTRIILKMPERSS